jgi:hypothetical protein
MEFSWLALLHLIHLMAAAAWFGAVLFGMVFLQPVLKTAGEAGKGFMAAVQRHGGFGRFMSPAAITTLLSGAILYWARGYHAAPFGSIPEAVLSTGAIIAVVGWGLGTFVGAPIQRKMARIGSSVGPSGPTPEQAAELQALQASMMRWGPLVGVTVLLAFVLMAGRSIIT